MAQINGSNSVIKSSQLNPEQTEEKKLPERNDITIDLTQRDIRDTDIQLRLSQIREKAPPILPFHFIPAEQTKKQAKKEALTEEMPYPLS